MDITPYDSFGEDPAERILECSVDWEHGVDFSRIAEQRRQHGVLQLRTKHISYGILVMAY